MSDGQTRARRGERLAVQHAFREHQTEVEALRAARARTASAGAAFRRLAALYPDGEPVYSMAAEEREALVSWCDEQIAECERAVAS